MTARDALRWDEVGEAWQRRRPQRLWRRHSDAVNAALLERWLPKRCERVLKTDLFDEANGAGLADVLGARAGTVVGVDVAPSMASAAGRDHDVISATVGDARALPFRDGAFDAVVSNSTLDHFRTVDEIDVSLQEIRRVLRPGGELVLTLDNSANPLVWVRNALPFAFLHRVGLVPYFVGATLGPSATAEHLRAVGMEVFERSAVLHCPRAPAVVAAGIVDRIGSDALRALLLRMLRGCEVLEHLPTRDLTGYFVAARARRPLP
jgi:SAM-dependent methyltransferase